KFSLGFFTQCPGFTTSNNLIDNNKILQSQHALVSPTTPHLLFFFFWSHAC
ncbi:hypothetical protein TorRG33x02_012520, partial [Trema orientale]